MAESFLNGRVVLHAGDMLAVLPALEENSIDACVCDPPYHLTSIVKRFGADDAAPAKTGKTGAYARSSVGFMGKVWDGGDIAFQVETWRQVLRVLKPGAHLLAFGGTRTYGRMQAAIEDAGFDVRDTIAWVFGSGFPKSHDVSKGIDRSGGKQLSWFGPWLRIERERRGITQKQLAVNFPSETGGLTGCVANWELGLNIPTIEQFNTLCRVMSLPFEYLDDLEREVIGQKTITKLAVAPGQDNDRSAITMDVTESRTDAARQWEGWGTALKPAMELICVARKPLSEPTIAANVLKWGTGALNIDGCRIGIREEPKITDPKKASNTYGVIDVPGGKLLPDGRWPANIIHDGSEEVLAGFPDLGTTAGAYVRGSAVGNNIYGDGMGNRQAGHQQNGFGDSGSAARFFYTSKADTDDRLGSKHPTVKPLDLMQYLVRLVTPPNGTVLDCFAGTGTAGEAAFREGMRAVLIERESEYQADIRRRMALVLAGPDERSREAIKERMKDKPRDDGPLFNSPPNKGGGKYADGRSKSKYFVALDPKVAE